MAPKGSQSKDAQDNSMEVPHVVIAQAEAAASQDRTDDGGPLEPASTTAGNKRAEKFATEETPIEHVPSIAYGPKLGEVDVSQDGFNTGAKVADDGRLNINISQKSRRLSDLLVPALRSQLNIQQVPEPAEHPPGYIPSALSGLPGQQPPPPLNVVIHVVGSRGDVQPFVALGKVLKEKYHHRVRLATHPTFRGFIEENGLEFFSIGGDPAELMAFMVKNPGLMPGMDSLRSGDVGKRRKGMYEIVQGCWRSCIEVGDGTGIRASDDHLDSRSSLDSGVGMDGDPNARPFVADAIIANPPSFAHIHIAEKMGIPLHLMFTMPWSPTQAFPHPLANIQSSNAESSVTNFISYALVEMMTWQGLGDVINRFREKSLQLEPVSLMWAPGMASRMKIPYTYCWSPALIPKPKDWGPHISISGFYFLSLASNYTPAPDLAAFLEAGPPPVYIGFGSIVVDDPNAMTKLIFDAVKKSGQRALVSKGWGGFGADTLGIPEGVFMLGNVPHDWLFNHVSCVVHHGGAGTTAAGIALGKPTVVVPFFGDQPFWGAMCARAGAGPVPVPYKQLTADNLAASIAEALKPTTLERARELGAKIASEKGTEVGAESFHEKMDIDSLRCLVSPSRAAVWRVKRTTIRLSAFAATTLGNEGLLDFNNLKLYRPCEYDSEDGPWDPISGGASALMGTIGSLMMGVADFPVEIADKVTGFQSGLKAAGKPLEGAKKEGFAGLIKGFGKGIGGVVLKPGAAIWGLPGYTFKGIYKELQKHLGSSVQNYIVAARTAQGYEDWHNSSQAERLDVVSRWQAIQVDIEKEKHHVRHGSFQGNHCYLLTTIHSLEERKKKMKDKKADKKANKKHKKGIHHDEDDDETTEVPPTHPFVSQSRQSGDVDSSPDNADFEEAIKASVAATSKGDPEQDAMIEKAIRASVKELQAAQKEGDDKDAMQRAIEASVAEATRVEKAPAAGDHDGAEGKALKLALQRSLSEHPSSEKVDSPSGVDLDDPGVDTDDDENIKAAIERSKTLSIKDPDVELPIDEDFQKAIEASKNEHEQGLSREKTEEELVMEYMKTQSSLEEEHKRELAALRAKRG
ncbi:hypothetical protein P7C71_g2788, partial [Lecanoromycetidae sp. Uapishka_2]